MNTYKISITHGMFGDYWTVTQTSSTGAEKVYPYFDSEHDAQSFIQRLKEYNDDYR